MQNPTTGNLDNGFAPTCEMVHCDGPSNKATLCGIPLEQLSDRRTGARHLEPTRRATDCQMCAEAFRFYAAVTGRAILTT
jgi:hypothetical protein